MPTGEQLGQYFVLEPIGEGGMGTVYVGEHHLLRHQVAIKLLHERHLNNLAMQRRFQNEAQAIAGIDHPGIVKLFDIGRATDGRAYVVMELLRGQSLRQRLGVGALPTDRALPFAVQIASALDAAHQSGIVHRDLKPENIFIVRDPDMTGGERVKILDFGIAKRTQIARTPSPEITRTGILVGTPSYMAPEQCRCDDVIDARADVYAFGVVLYEMLAGSLPFSGADTEQMIAQHMYTAPRPLQDPDLPDGLSDVVMRCLAKKAENRYQTMYEVAEVLAAMAGREPELAIPEGHPDATPVSGMETLPALVPPSEDATTAVHQRAPARGLRLRTWLLAAAVAVIAGVSLAAVREAARAETPSSDPTIATSDDSDPDPIAAPDPDPDPDTDPDTEPAADTETDEIVFDEVAVAPPPDPAVSDTDTPSRQTKPAKRETKRAKKSPRRKKPRRTKRPPPRAPERGDPFAEIETPTVF